MSAAVRSFVMPVVYMYDVCTYEQTCARRFWPRFLKLFDTILSSRWTCGSSYVSNMEHVYLLCHSVSAFKNREADTTDWFRGRSFKFFKNHKKNGDPKMVFIKVSGCNSFHHFLYHLFYIYPPISNTSILNIWWSWLQCSPQCSSRSANANDRSWCVFSIC